MMLVKQLERGAMDAVERLELAKTVLRQGEIKLEGQLKLVLAAQQRAMTGAAVFASVGAGAFALGLHDLTAPISLVAGTAVAGTALVVAALICVWATWPGDWRLAGNIPSNWWNDGVESRPLTRSLRKETSNYDGRIIANRAELLKLAGRFKFGAVLGCVAPALGLGSGLLIRWLW